MQIDLLAPRISGTARKLVDAFFPGALTIVLGKSASVPNLASGGLGSIAGVLIADYWLVRKKNLNLGDLYRRRGVYSGWNWRAVAATLLGCVFAWIGLIIPSLRVLYDYGWFVGFGVAFLVHWGLMKALTPAKGLAFEEVV